MTEMPVGKAELIELLEELNDAAHAAGLPTEDVRDLKKFRDASTYWIGADQGDLVKLFVTSGGQMWTFASGLPLWLANYLSAFNPHAMMDLTAHLLEVLDAEGPQ